MLTAIILAAGLGRRLSLGVPKCLLEIAGRSILSRQVEALRAAGVDHFAIVVGYREEDVRRHLACEAGRFTFITNERYAETNTIYSLYLARDHFGSGFFYTNGDVLFDRRLTCRLLPADSSSVVAVKPGRLAQEEVKVAVEPDPRQANAWTRVCRIGKQLDPAQSLGEFVGVARFGLGIVASLAETLVQCVEAEGIVGDHFETAVDRLCRAGHSLIPIDIGDLPCGEIDFPEDLEQARNEIGPQLLA